MWCLLLIVNARLPSLLVSLNQDCLKAAGINVATINAKCGFPPDEGQGSKDMQTSRGDMRRDRSLAKICELLNLLYWNEPLNFSYLGLAQHTTYEIQVVLRDDLFKNRYTYNWCVCLCDLMQVANSLPRCITTSQPQGCPKRWNQVRMASFVASCIAWSHGRPARWN